MRRVARRVLPVLALLAPVPALAQPGVLEVRIEGLRNQNGSVRLCLTSQASAYPGCTGDPRAFRLTVPAARASRLVLRNVPAGSYGIAVIHDENGNGELDTRFGVPREGYGFSNNPGFSFGVPSFSRVRFAHPASGSTHVVQLRYIL